MYELYSRSSIVCVCEHKRNPLHDKIKGNNSKYFQTGCDVTDKIISVPARRTNKRFRDTLRDLKARGIIPLSREDVGG